MVINLCLKLCITAIAKAVAMSVVAVSIAKVYLCLFMFVLSPFLTLGGRYTLAGQYTKALSGGMAHEKNRHRFQFKGFYRNNLLSSIIFLILISYKGLKSI